MSAISNLLSNCASSAIPYPTVFGAQFTSIQASVTRNYTVDSPNSTNPNHWDISGSNISFCNVTITHTHPGQEDKLTTQIWLPIDPPWNKRLQATGGGGWVAGLSAQFDFHRNGAVAEGYATVSTDAGISGGVEDWALKSPGNVDLNRLQNFASVGLKDAVLATKSVIKSFYGEEAKYSYFSGCSQGGRQGLMFAQRYPDVFDGIAAAAPAINYGNFFLSELYPALIMQSTGEIPQPCELDAVQAAAFKVCDGNDGLVDGIISHPDSCTFDPYSVVGAALNCSEAPHVKAISKAAARVAEAAWYGARTENGEFLWYTSGIQAPLTGPLAIASPACSTNGTCSVLVWPVYADWLRFFLIKDADYSFKDLTRKEFERVYRISVQEYDSIIGTSWADLREFRDAGGKAITYHGTADTGIPFYNSRHYYKAVTAVDSKVHNYYRLFEAPGLSHCSGGIGGYPGGTFDALVKWVEQGIAPDSLEARSATTNKTSILCPYPKKAVFAAGRFVCE
ncbi:Tannase/feruloyl esterase [Dendryphion nanum]|uniref:Carboxylic ester hydrolase n=1 Tax=Dendryphion nanum TaxID=256645 RepID=A0A9P9D195_9PLEO|nr:Tannase/feruloyl esterase [Dendryphion nanum]